MRTKLSRQQRAFGSNLRTARIVNNGLWLPGKSGNYASTPDSPTLSASAEIDLAADFTAVNYGVNAVLMSQYGSGAGNISWLFYLVGGDKSYRLAIYDSGSGSLKVVGGFHGLAPGQRGKFRVTYKKSTELWSFFDSSDFVTWTPHGTPKVLALVGPSISDVSVPIEIGSYLGGTGFPFRGIIHRVQMRTVVDGAVIFDKNFENTPLNSTSFAEDSPNGAIITVNKR